MRVRHYRVAKSKEELAANWKQNIKLGLDLRGGSHLVLQVQVQDAFKAEADQTIERVKEELRKASVNYTAMDRNDPATLEEAEPHPDQHPAAWRR